MINYVLYHVCAGDNARSYIYCHITDNKSKPFLSAHCRVDALGKLWIIKILLLELVSYSF